MFEPITSSYFIDKEPERFGAQQDDYVKMVKQIVKEAVFLLQKAVIDKLDLEEFFYTLIDFLSKKRGKLAKKHGTKNSEFYGFPRDLTTTLIAFTPLAHTYQEYQDRVLPMLQTHLSTMEHDNLKFKVKEKSVSFKDSYGKKSRLDIKNL